MLETEGQAIELVRDVLNELDIHDTVRVLVEESALTFGGLVNESGQVVHSVSRRWKVKILPIPYDENKRKEFTLITDSFNHINDAKAFVKQRIQE